ncbi:hypothetical protein LIER_25750 [Lithospermum erythrorhizon]|uniref:Uncharacterized protein n=1 Tax=Lithospermum erythrorhizon TaxID=34254 RepID=A0AAV3RA77_LITER
MLQVEKRMFQFYFFLLLDDAVAGWEEDVLVLLVLDVAGTPSIPNACFLTSSLLSAASLFRYLLGLPGSILISGGRMAGYGLLVQIWGLSMAQGNGCK